MWHGAKITTETTNNIDLLMIPLNKNISDGKTDNANARNTVFFLKQIIQMIQYINTMAVFATRYTANASSDHQPEQVPGMLIIIKPKQPNRPICSNNSTVLFCHLFAKPSLHFMA